MDIKVNVWEEDILLPTYGIGKPEKNPMFFENRVYQGSSGVVYPYPVIEKISDTCQEETYHAVYLENEYIKVMILPELGGRVQMAYDKIKKRHFIYYNHVIKPALVGLTGPWISGGIEFNWPQHHRPSTYLPVDFTIEENADGSATVWVSERERMFHQKGMAGFTYVPAKLYLKFKENYIIRLLFHRPSYGGLTRPSLSMKPINRFSLPMSMLYLITVSEMYQNILSLPAFIIKWIIQQV